MQRTNKPSYFASLTLNLGWIDISKLYESLHIRHNYLVAFCVVITG
jgi:hypothetical protein